MLSAELSAPAPFVRTLRVELDGRRRSSWSTGPKATRTSACRRRHPRAPASLTLTRLRPRRSYQYQVVGTATTGTFTSDTVPTDLAASIGTVTGRRSAPLVLLHLYQPTGFMGYAILDEHDEVVWYWRTPASRTE